MTSDFLDISNPKAVLERALRSYSCLTTGDSFQISYNGRRYEIEVREAKPGPAISVIETDCQVDFEAPKDYVEPARAPRGGGAAAAAAAGPAASAAPAPAVIGGGAAGAGGGAPEAAAGAAAGAPPEEAEAPKFLPFAGAARRLDGKAATSAPIPMPAAGAAAAAAAARAGGGAAASGSGSSPAAPAAAAAGSAPKAGTVVSFGNEGNRLLAKLNRDRAAAAGGGAGGGGGAAAAPPPAAAGDAKKAEAEEPKFKPFAGKGNSLRG